MGFLLKKTISLASDLWPVFRVIFCTIFLLLFFKLITREFDLHRDQLILQREFKRLRVEARTYYTSGDYHYKKLIKLLKSKRFKRYVKK